jgi:CHAT domain-containing protein/tetratricopeptide (TPR) repeat protein
MTRQLVTALACTVLLACADGVPAQDARAKAEIQELFKRAESLKKAGRLPEAARAYEELVKKAKTLIGPRELLTADFMNNLAGLYRLLGELTQAEALFLASIEIKEARRGKDDPDVARSQNNLAELYRTLGQYEKAEPLYKKAGRTFEAKKGKDSLEVATVLNNLGLLYQAQGQFTKAEPLYKQSLTIRRAKAGKKVGTRHLSVASSYNNLAGLYHDMGQFEKAVKFQERCLEIREQLLGKDDLAVAVALNNVAELYHDLGQLDKARPLLERALKIRQGKLGGDHPDVGVALNNLAGQHAAAGRPREAARLIDLARRGARRHIASVLPGLSEEEKAQFFERTTARAHLGRALSLGLAARAAADLAALSASWLLNGKALDQESLAASHLLLRQRGEGAIGKASDRLLELRKQLATLSFTSPKPGQEKERLLTLERLSAEEQKLAKKLRKAGGYAGPPAWVELDDVRRDLPDDAVLIDVAQFRLFNFKAKAASELLPAHYVAWVTPKRGPVQIVNLGPAKEIDEAVTQVRQGVQNAPSQINEKGEEKAEKALRASLALLSKRVLVPLLPHIGKSKRWLISPDGNLWLAPWEALLLPGGKYAVEEHQLSYLASGRDVLPASAAKVAAAAPLVLADPNFDLDPSKGARGKAKAGALRFGRVQALPGTAVEAEAIKPSLEEYAGAKPRLFTRDKALEGVVKAARNPRVLVLCTHGFFLPDRAGQGQEKEAARRGAPAKKWENPLLRCGLLLAGCNNAGKAKGGDDGVLTGLEVVGLDLRGTELVVLSACDTGIGEVQKGEGVAGLRQAFQLAGARSVVSTLWKVPDQESARLMAFFFQNLSKGMSKADALRAAKLRVIKSRRDDAAAAAHPFFWAAFTVTGQP